MRRADLHVHSSRSDGTLSPSELAALAKRSGLACVALCDHDSVEGLPELFEAGERLGFPVVGGVELSLAHGKTTHLLGLGVAAEKGRPPELEFVKSWRRDRNQKIFNRLLDLGVKLEWERLEALSAGGQIGRPHFARAMVESGAVSSMNEAFEKYLGKGAAAYADKVRLSPPQAIALLRERGFAPVLAHPVSLGLARERWPEAIKDWVGWGLAGVEAYHPDQDEGFSSFVAGLAKRHGLVATAGSDYHGANKRVPITWTRDNSPLGIEVVEALRDKL